MTGFQPSNKELWVDRKKEEEEIKNFRDHQTKGKERKVNRSEVKEWKVKRKFCHHALRFNAKQDVAHFFTLMKECVVFNKRSV